MKKILFLIAAATVMLAVGCKKDDPTDGKTPAKAEEMTFQASVTAVTGGPAVEFAKGDAITVFDSKSGNKFTTQAGGANASFAGKAVKSDSYSAVYPALENTARYSGKASTTIPVSQTAVKNAAPAGGIAVAYSTNTTLAFKYVTALLKVTAPADQKILSVEVVASGDKALAGEAKVSLGADAAVEVTGSSKVALRSETAMDGVYYIVVAPATLAGGYELNVTDEAGRRATVKVESEVKIEAGKALELAALNNLEWSDDVENPNPTAVPGYIFKATFNKADFNMISDPSFEAINPENIAENTNWQFTGIDPNIASYEVVAGHTGNQAIKLTNNQPGIWYDVAKQTVALHSGTTYVYNTFIDRTTPHCYNGVRTYLDGPLEEINGPDTYVEGAGWTKYEKEFTQGATQQWGDTFVGLWGDAGVYAIMDDVKLAPKDYAFDSIEPGEVTAVETFNNKTFDEISSAAKVIAFKGLDGKYVIAFSGLTIGGVNYDNGVAIAESEAIANGLSITKLVKSGINPVPFLAPDENEIAVVPNSGFAKNGKLYIHYYGKAGQDPENPDAWTTTRGGFVVSEDGGLTWTKCAGEWGAASCFVESSVFEYDGKMYMAGSNAGRDLGFFAGFRFARIDATEDFTDPAKWEYLDRINWVASEADVPGLSVSLMGCRGESVLVFNTKWQRWMLIYRGRQGGVVYRDAAAVDGDWSGEKLLVKDAGTAKFFAPSVLEITPDGDLILMVSAL